MVGRRSPHIALVFLMTLAPAPGLVDAAFADGVSSQSRSAARHATSADSTTVATTSSKGRRATRGGSSSETATASVQKRSKKSRRNPGGVTDNATLLTTAQGNQSGLVALAQSGSESFHIHVETADFNKNTGALALYQLAGKVVADMPLTEAERIAFATALKDTDLPTLISDTEARLMGAMVEGETLDAISAALGVPRPAPSEDPSPNLGASLKIDISTGAG